MRRARKTSAAPLKKEVSMFCIRLVGDADFRQIIRGLLTAHSDTPVDFHDFALLAGQVSKRDLKVYFDEWIYGTESSKLLLGNSSIEEMTARYR
jgi:hypothetical protein